MERATQSGGCCFICPGDGKPLERLPEGERAEGMQVADTRQDWAAHSSSSVPHAQDQELGIVCELKLVSPALSFSPTVHQALGSGPFPSLAASAEPPGKTGRRHSRLRTAGACSAKYFARAVRDRQARGEFGACGAGGSSGWAGGELWLPPGLLNPVEMTDPPTSHPPQLYHSLWVWRWY